jgi:tetratricopeptide (TPR) repeat protein
MKSSFKFGLVAAATVLVFAGSASAQLDEICREFGIAPSMDSPFAHVPYVYGRVVAKGFDVNAKIPKLTISLVSMQATERLTLGRSGNYCFKRRSNSGELVIEVNGIEAGRRTLTASGSEQQREDFEIYSNESQGAAPGVVSAKFSHPRNEKTVDLYKRTLDLESKGETGKAIESLREIVVVDPADFVAWAKLGSLYLTEKNYAEADAALRRSLELKVEYTPAWIYVGKLRLEQQQAPAAIEIFKHVITLEPQSARAFQLLGQSYLQDRKGTLGAEALNEAIRLDPIGMAECHLLLAHLFDLAGAKNMAAREYKVFLTKVPDYPQKKKLEKFIKENPQ